MNRKRLSIRGASYLITAFICPLIVSCSNDTPKEETVRLTGITVNDENVQKYFVPNEEFNYDGLVVTASYSDQSSKEVFNYTVIEPDLSSVGQRGVRVTYSEGGITKTSGYTVYIVAPASTLTSITLSGSYQTSFTVNDTFTYQGLIVTAHYSDSSAKTVTSFNVSSPDMSSSGTKAVNVSYTEGGITKTASYNISVNNVVVTLSSISLSGTYKTIFEVGDTFSYQGLIVTATYSNGTTRVVTPTSVSSPNMSSSGTKTITVSYTEGGVTKTNSYTITVNEKVVDKLDPRSEPYFSNQYYLNHIGDIKTVWDSYRGNGVTVAVIDGGFKYNHEDFYDKDGNSKASSKSAYFYTSGSNTTTQVGPQYVVGGDAENHGTFCAGVVGAALNNKGVVGIAPECTLMLLKTDLKPKSINAAFKYASDNGAKVITISIGSYSDYNGDLVNDGSNLTTIFNDAVSYCRNKGTVVVSAAGNGGPSECNRPTEPTYPGATIGVIGAGGLAANSSSDIWTGSSYNGSTTFCDVFAPSAGMFGMCTHTSTGYDGDWKGTSFASPIVAGIAALYFEKYPTNTVTQFENDLYNSCLAMDEPSKTSHGAVDVAKTLGITASSENITIKVKSSWSSMNAYLWNLRTQQEYTSWPGVNMSKSGDIYSISINPYQYPNIIFSTNSGQTQTVDILTTFLKDKIYNLSSGNAISIDGNSRWIGRYSQ